MRFFKSIHAICLFLICNHAIGASAVAQLTHEGFKILFVGTNYPSMIAAQKATSDRCLTFLKAKQSSSQGKINQCSDFSKGQVTSNGPAFVSFTVNEYKAEEAPRTGIFIDDKDSQAESLARKMCENNSYTSKKQARQCHKPTILLDCVTDPAEKKEIQSGLGLFGATSAIQECAKQPAPSNPTLLIYYPPDAPDLIVKEPNQNLATQ